jgi:hypothetical protein
MTRYLSNVGLLTKREAREMETMNTPIETIRGWLADLTHSTEVAVALRASTNSNSGAVRVRGFLVNLVATVTQNMQARCSFYVVCRSE